MDSSVSPTHGDQEGTAYNRHFGCTCYHPLFLFNQFGDLERCECHLGNVGLDVGPDGPDVENAHGSYPKVPSGSGKPATIASGAFAAREPGPFSEPAPAFRKGAEVAIAVGRTARGRRPLRSGSPETSRLNRPPEARLHKRHHLSLGPSRTRAAGGGRAGDAAVRVHRGKWPPDRNLYPQFSPIKTEIAICRFGSTSDASSITLWAPRCRYPSGAIWGIPV